MSTSLGKQSSLTHTEETNYFVLCAAGQMASIYRILIKTHHMTSRKKIFAITKAAKRLSCSVILKTGGPPGVMLAEGEEALEWMEIVRVSRNSMDDLERKMKLMKVLAEFEIQGLPFDEERGS
jgi:hypothetical protein